MLNLPTMDIPNSQSSSLVALVFSYFTRQTERISEFNADFPNPIKKKKCSVRIVIVQLIFPLEFHLVQIIEHTTAQHRDTRKNVCLYCEKEKEEIQTKKFAADYRLLIAATGPKILIFVEQLRRDTTFLLLLSVYIDCASFFYPLGDFCNHIDRFARGSIFV